MAFAKIAAENENSDAMNLVGLFYTQYDRGTSDFNEGLRWFNKSAYEYNNPVAQLFLAITFEDNVDKRKKLVQSASNGGLEEAIILMEGNKSNEIINSIGNSLIDKILSSSSIPNKRAGLGNTPKSQITQSSNTYNSNKYDFDILIEQANNEDVQAMCKIGEAYLYGEGVSPDKKQAFEWMLKAADREHSHAQATVSLMFAKGEGVDSNDKYAFQYALKSAESNNPYGLCVLADYYFQGVGTKKEPLKALDCLLKAAQMEYIPAYGALSIAYLIGDSSVVDYEEAFKWAKIGAQEGDAVAQSILSMLYTCGVGTNKNFYEAEKWGKKAIDQDEIAGYAALAKLYSSGVSKDTNKALEYIEKAISEFNEAQQDISDDYKDWDILDFYCVKGEVYLADNQLDKAREMASEIVKVNPEYSNVFDSGLMDFYYGRINNDKQTPMFSKKEINSDVDINIPINNIKNENTFALIIANEDYNKVSPVSFALKDGQKIYEYLNSTLGIDKGHISILENATLNDMRYELNRLKKISETYKGNASFFVYYIGHGIPDEKNGNGYLLPVDGYGNDVSTAYSLDELYSQLGKLNAKKTILVTDACFSGANKSGDMLVAARGVAMRAKSNQATGNLIAFSACQGDETAYSYDEKGHGLLTYYFLKKLQETGGKATLGELEEYIVDNVGKTAIVINGKSQTPKVSVSPELKDTWREQTLVE